MLVSAFPAAAFATNCYVVAPGERQECVVVDPGIGVLDRLADVLQRHGLRPAAVLLTHGHLDHVYSVTPVCGGHGVPALVHGDDRYRLADPLATLDPGLLAMLEAQFGRSAQWVEPADVRAVVDAEVLEVAGLTLRVLHAPGHTEGSVMFALPGAPDGVEAGSTVLSGDVLFAGSIGRTDLPGGDMAAMVASLRDKVLTLPDDAYVLPGHGPATTLAHERATNPYLLQVAEHR